MSEKNVLKKFQMSELYLGCLDEMSEVNFNTAETLHVCSPLSGSILAELTTSQISIILASHNFARVHNFNLCFP